MAEPYVYVPFKWLDQIIELNEFGEVVYEYDDSGKPIYLTDHFGNYILDPITNKPLQKPRYLQIGTKHSAFRENYQEEGIAKSHERLNGHEDEIMRMKIQLELNDKSPGNSGVFADTFDGEPESNKIIRLTATTDIIQAVSAGTTELPVDSVAGFIPFTEVTVYDGENSEDVLITAIGDGVITVQALVYDYVKGARVARSTASIKDGQMVNGDWGTYSVSVMEVV